MSKEILGDYSILKEVGKGALGVVYLAEHRFIKKQYILKVLDEELIKDRNFLQRFEEDVGLLAKLEHPNLVKIHNVSFAQGKYFLVTSCIVDNIGETTNLSQYLLNRAVRLTEDEIFDFLSQIASALNYAHHKTLGDRKGFAHRGLKPNNILIGTDQGKIKLYLTDFGLSRIVGMGTVLSRTYSALIENLGIRHLKSQQGKTFGFPLVDVTQTALMHESFLQNYAFLAPEQKKIDQGAEIDYKADVYAFGVLTYYLLTGEYPEGIFDIPTTPKFNWKPLIVGCLQKVAQKRPDNLLNVLETVKGGKKEGIEPSRQLPEASAPPFAMEPVKQVNNQASDIKSTLVKEKPLASPVRKEEQKGTSQEKEIAKVPEEAQAFSNPLLVDKKESDNIFFKGSRIVHQYSPKSQATSKADIKPLLTDIVQIPAGTYYQGCAEGSRDQRPCHKVNLPSFAIEKHPVTNEQFLLFLNFMGGEKDGANNDLINLRDSRIRRAAGKISIESGYNKHPVVGVSWFGAVAYANWIKRRLPTEAEWEIAARGGIENAEFPYGDSIEKSQANFFSFDTTTVMSYPANGYGLYDMAGNVYEWCQDWYGYNYYELAQQEPDNPQGPIQGVYRVMRGGCWKSLRDDLRCCHRHRNKPSAVDSTYGFRCAYTILE